MLPDSPFLYVWSQMRLRAPEVFVINTKVVEVLGVVHMGTVRPCVSFYVGVGVYNL